MAEPEEWRFRLVEDIAEIRAQLTRMNGTLSDIAAEVGGAPDYRVRGQRRNIRERLHDMDKDMDAVRMLGDGMLSELRKLTGTVSGLEAERGRLQAGQDALAKQAKEKAREWSRLQKGSLFLFAFAAAIEAGLRLAGIGG